MATARTVRRKSLGTCSRPRTSNRTFLPYSPAIRWARDSSPLVTSCAGRCMSTRETSIACTAMVPPLTIAPTCAAARRPSSWSMSSRTDLKCANRSSSRTSSGRKSLPDSSGRSRSSFSMSSNACARFSTVTSPSAADSPLSLCISRNIWSIFCRKPASSRAGTLSTVLTSLSVASLSERNDTSWRDSTRRMPSSMSICTELLDCDSLSSRASSTREVTSLTDTSICRAPPSPLTRWKSNSRYRMSCPPWRRSKLTSTSASGLMLLIRFSLTRSPHSSLTYFVAVSSVFSGTSWQSRSSNVMSSKFSRRISAESAAECALPMRKVAVDQEQALLHRAEDVPGLALGLARGALVTRLEQLDVEQQGDQHARRMPRR